MTWRDFAVVALQLSAWAWMVVLVYWLTRDRDRAIRVARDLADDVLPELLKQRDEALARAAHAEAKLAERAVKETNGGR